MKDETKVMLDNILGNQAEFSLRIEIIANANAKGIELTPDQVNEIHDSIVGDEVFSKAIDGLINFRLKEM